MKLTFIVFFLSSFSSLLASVDSQLVNLNVKMKSRGLTNRSDLVMPLYQKAELERRLNNKDYKIELEPKLGKNPNDVIFNVKVSKISDGHKVLANKVIKTQMNQETVLNVKGMVLEIKPTTL